MTDILFLAHRVPFPPNRGDKIRSHHLLRKLASMGRVHVGCFAEGDEDHSGIAELADLAASHCVVNRTKPLTLAGAQAVLTGKPVSLTGFYSGKLKDWVRETLIRYPVDAIVVFSGQMGQYIPADFKGRTVIDLCDVDSAKFEGYAEAGERVWLNAREARLLALEETRLAERCDVTTLISDAEAALFLSRQTGPSLPDVRVIGNGIDAHVFDPAKVEPHPVLAGTAGPHFVFTGQMDYRPNEAAAQWAIEHFLRTARERWAEAEIHVVGRNPTAALKAHSQTPGVRVWGEVPDVKPFLAGASCVIAPLQIARGVQNKVLEAMAMARPVLLTPEAATGIDARDGKHWMVESADAALWVARYEALRSDGSARQTLGQSARAFVLEHHTWDAMLAPLEELVRPNSTAQSAGEGARNAA
jgi:sugar transferase (PEP-CTERM/EpsH1 system associated)